MNIDFVTPDLATVHIIECIKIGPKLINDHNKNMAKRDRVNVVSIFF